MKLRWHIDHRSDGLFSEYVTDENGIPLFKITTVVGDGWILEESCIGESGDMRVQRISWNVVWEFDHLEQARSEAELRYHTVMPCVVYK